MKQVTETGQHRIKLAGKSPYPLNRLEFFLKGQLPTFIDDLKSGFNKGTVIRSTALLAMTGPQIPGVVDTLRNSSSPATAASLEPSGRLTLDKNSSTRGLLFQDITQVAQVAQVAQVEPEEPIDDEAIAEEIDDFAQAAIGESAPDEPVTVVPVAQPVATLTPTPTPSQTPSPEVAPTPVSRRFIYINQTPNAVYEGERAYCEQQMNEIFDVMSMHPRLNGAVETFSRANIASRLNQRETFGYSIITTLDSRRASQDPATILHTLNYYITVPRENENLIQHNMRCFVDSWQQPTNSPRNAITISGIFIPIHRFEQARQIIAQEGSTRSARELEGFLNSPRMQVILTANATWEMTQIYEELGPRLPALGIAPSPILDGLRDGRRDIMSRYSSLEDQQLAWREVVNRNLNTAVPTADLRGYYFVS